MSNFERLGRLSLAFALGYAIHRIGTLAHDTYWVARANENNIRFLDNRLDRIEMTLHPQL